MMERASLCWIVAIAISAGMSAAPTIASEPAKPQRIKILIKETAGIRRFGYPVNFRVALERPLALSGGLRLLEQGRPVAAQFTQFGPKESTTQVDVDFAVNHAPYQIREYLLEAGPIESGPKPGPGLRLAKERDRSRVHFGAELE